MWYAAGHRSQQKKSLQDAIDYAASTSSPLHLEPGNYEIGSGLRLPSGLRLVGPGAVLRPALAWSDATAPAVKAESATDVVVDGIEIDGRGTSRLLVNEVPQLIRIAASSQVKLVDVVLRNAGVSNGAPSGPALAIVALDAVDDLDGAGLGTTIGSCRDINVRGLRIVQEAGAVVAFGVRVATDFEKERAVGSFTHRCESIRFTDLDVEAVAGECYWNMIEFAGGGTRDVWVTRSRFRGKCLSAIDFDKGCSFGYALDCIVRDGGKPTRLLADGTVRLAAISVHGATSTYRTSDVVVRGCKVRDHASASTEVYGAFLSAQNADRVTFEDCDVANLNEEDYGYAVVVDSDTNDVTLSRVSARQCAGGITTNLGAKGYTRLRIEDCDLDVAANPLVLGAGGGAAAGSQTGLRVSRNRLRSAAGTGYVAQISNVWSRPVFEGNVLEGGLEAVLVEADKACLRDNMAPGYGTAYRINGAISANMAGNVGTRTLAGGALLIGVGNTWDIGD